MLCASGGSPAQPFGPMLYWCPPRATNGTQYWVPVVAELHAAGGFAGTPTDAARSAAGASRSRR